MARMISGPSEIAAAGNIPKRIEEFVGRVSSGTETVSIARMKSPEGWIEPGQTPEFSECSVVLKGMLRVETSEGIHEVGEGQAIIVDSDEWVQYSTPLPGGAEYISVCQPAFSPGRAHRDSCLE